MAYGKQNETFNAPEKVDICSPLVDADGDMSYSQPSLRGELPSDPLNLTGGKKKKEK